MTEGERGAKRQEKYGVEPYYLEANHGTAFPFRLISQYESHIRVTKETIQFVIRFTKNIPHCNCVTKERTPKLSHPVSHQGTVRLRTSLTQTRLNTTCNSSSIKPSLMLFFR